MTKDANLGEPGGAARAKWPRRRVLTAGLGSVAGLAAIGVTGAELVSHGILPGKTILDELDGACSVPGPHVSSIPPGPSFSGTLYSAARNRRVGYTIAYPPGHRAGAQLPLVVMLHGYGGNHADALVGMSPAQALALRVDGRPLAPMAMVTVDGGGGYWNPHPGDDPMAMVIAELIPRCQRLGLGRPPRRIGRYGSRLRNRCRVFGRQYDRTVTGGAVIGRIVQRSGIPASEVARRLGVTEAQVSAWMGGDPPLSVVESVARACSTDLARILAEPEPDPHDVGLLETTLAMTVDQRLERLKAYVRFVQAGRAALRTVR